jgi:hypothetical protein
LKIPAQLRLPAALGGAVLEVELDLPDEALRSPAGEPELLSEQDLRARWRCSARTLARMRAERSLSYLQPTPRRFLYRREEIERLEAESERGALRVVPARAGSLQKRRRQDGRGRFTSGDAA